MVKLAKLSNFILFCIFALIFVNILLSLLSLNFPLLISHDNLRFIFYFSNFIIFGGVFLKLVQGLVFCFHKYPYNLIETRYDTLPQENLEDVFVIIPAYNEEDSIVQAIKECKKFAQNVIVINDGSDDATATRASNEGAFVVNHGSNRGLAMAMKTGIKTAIERGAKVIVNFDADMQYDAKDIPSLAIPVLKGEYDLMMGSRLGGTIEKMSFLKKFGNKIFSRLIGNITKTYISDGQSGFRAFSADFGKNIKIRTGFTYTQQMILEAAEKGYKIGEIPIFFAKRSHGGSRLMRGILHFAFGAWKLILQFFAEYYPFKLFLNAAKILGGLGVILINIASYTILQSIDFGSILSIYGLIFIVTAIIIACMGLIAETKK